MDFIFINQPRNDLDVRLFELKDAPPVAGGWRKMKPSRHAKKVTHPVPSTPKRPRG